MTMQVTGVAVGVWDGVTVGEAVAGCGVTIDAGVRVGRLLVVEGSLHANIRKRAISKDNLFINLLLQFLDMF